MSRVTDVLSQPRYRLMLITTIGVAAMSLGRMISGNDDLTSSGTIGVALRTAVPIALAGLAGLFAERSGTVNIGLEGMMVMGTIFAGWWGWLYGPWMAVAGGIIGGLLAGMLMSLATTTFGVNHIVAGFAINILAPGVARFMANVLFTTPEAQAAGGAITSSPGNSGSMGRFTMPFTSGGNIGGWQSPDIFGWIEDRGWFIISDLAGFARGLTTNVSYDVMIAIALFFIATWVLWRTPVGLRLRSAGERPAAADSLGVSVARMRHLGMAISGSLAGLGGAVLVISVNRYQEAQVAGRGFLGLATLIFGNWRPIGIAAGAGLFGYAQGITLRTNPEQLVRALLLTAAIALAMTAVWVLANRNVAATGFMVLISIAVLWAYLATERPNNQLVFVTPYVVTLVAVSVGARRLRPPAEEGIPWFKGQL